MIAINQNLPYKLIPSPSNVEVITIAIGLSSPITLYSIQSPQLDC